jgi:N-acetylmuramoyl-L-alanine amidase
MAASAAPPLARLKSVRPVSTGSVTRITVEATGEIQWVADRLENPARLVFDFPRTVPGDGKRGIRTIPVGDARVKQLRVAETQPGKMRVVVDLAGPVDFSAERTRRTPGVVIQITSPRSLALQQAKPIRFAEETAVRQPVGRAEPRPPEPEPGPPLEGKRREPTAAEKMAAELAARPEPPRESAQARAAEPPLPMVAALPPAKAAPEPAPVSGPLRAASPAALPPPDRLPPAAAARGSQTLIRALGLKLGRVVLDPGHGGHDHGTIGRNGLTEKELVLDIAKRLGGLLEEQLGVEVIYTRTDDTFVPLEERTAMANEQRADLFLSIHANSAPYRSASGVETYYLNLSTSREALDLAARENASSQRSIHDLTSLIQKITTNEKIAESREFASKVQLALHGMSSRHNPGAQNRGVKKAPFVVLLGASMPSILTEIGFVSNPREEALLSKPEYRQRIAEGLLLGVKRYAESLSHFQIATKD